MIASLKAAIRGTLRRFGFEFRRVALPPSAGRKYDVVSPIANYSPWNTDSEFLTTYGVIQHNTLVDIYRCYELWTLVEQAGKLAGGILEVGVWRGGTGALIARKAVLSGIEDPVYLCDTFSGVVKAGEHDTHYKGGEHADTSQGTVEGLIRTLNLRNVRILNGVFPEETAHLIESGTRFRLCHVDVDVYESAKGVMAWIWDRMVPGGIVVYDDYGYSPCEGINTYVNEQRNENDRLVLHNLNGHAIVVKLQPYQV